MGGVTHDRRVMEKQRRIDVDVLVEEIQRYLAAVDVFRALGCNAGGMRRKEKG